jgi:hypothetical protein
LVRNARVDLLIYVLKEGALLGMIFGWFHNCNGSGFRMKNTVQKLCQRVTFIRTMLAVEDVLKCFQTLIMNTFHKRCWSSIQLGLPHKLRRKAGGRIANFIAHGVPQIYYIEDWKMIIDWLIYVCDSMVGEV